MSSTSIRIIELPEGYTSSRLVEHTFEHVEELFDYLMVIHIVGSKQSAPCILPCTLKAGPGKRTKSGRRRVTDAKEAYLLVFDLDHGNVEESDLEAALVDLDVQAVMWPTWKAGGVHGMRWRVVVPLARAVPGGAYKGVWKLIARNIERGLYEQGCYRPERGWVDWSGQTAQRQLFVPLVLPHVGMLPGRRAVDRTFLDL